MTENLVGPGAAVRRTVLGDAHCDAVPPPFTEPFYAYVQQTAWDQVWARPGLDLRTRSMLTMAVLAALRCERELAMHVAAARRLGVTPEQIQEVLLHTTVYAGAPAGNAAFAVAARVLASQDPAASQDATASQDAAASQDPAASQGLDE